ncbi:MAG: hypothetical protein COT81_02675 [Candidatus Buchananbacteria bacterium CG10_big_fil_rev_8_21_14_0_10_42_9]|uniref:Nucleoid-associated protein, YbaB/EbfC family n=1 Tax=Candidatus Buchananbacteria bacterium CG10_big_fil_rev_8_21_14_0_10_42_9 TaxID=1974526 RepID=A0A2H0W1G8_9BACT|nr:MAG: hypothetical protein COT81_02675 [Candidatus Buchananbacteria bacterium CG10_big_fil_rev_8_21_14_0_10_42_9]
MFNKLKQYKDLRSEAKTMQNILAKEKAEITKNGITIVMDGNQKVQSVKIAEDKSRESIERDLPDAIDEAIKKVQKIMAEKVRKGEITIPNMPGA